MIQDSDRKAVLDYIKRFLFTSNDMRRQKSNNNEMIRS